MDPDAVHEEWDDRSGEFSPTYYAHYGPNETSEAVRERLDAALGPDPSVLELGCSSGRHLAHLHAHGYTDLHGVDINEDAREVMAETYPDLAAAGTFRFDAIETVVTEFDDDRFDAVYSVETLQHIPRDNEWVFDEVARIAGELLLTAEIESGRGGSKPDGGDDADDGTRDGSPDRDADDRPVNYVNDDFPLYYRDWEAVFGDRGFEQVDVETVGRDTVRTFRPR